MTRTSRFALLAGALFASPAFSEPLSFDLAYPDDAAAAQPIRVASQRTNMGGGFIEFLFSGGDVQPRYAPRGEPVGLGEPSRMAVAPQYLPQAVSSHAP